MFEFLLIGWLPIVFVSYIIGMSYIMFDEGFLDIKISSVVTIVFLLVLYFGFKIDILNLIINEPIKVIGGLFIYLMIGGLWSIKKWKDFLTRTNKIKNFMGKIKEDWENFSKDNSGSDSLSYGINEFLSQFNSHEEFKTYVLNNQNDRMVSSCYLLPSPIDYKSMLSAYIIYWPFNLLSSSIRGILTGFVEFFYSAYDKITLSIVSKYDTHEEK